MIMTNCSFCGTRYDLSGRQRCPNEASHADIYMPHDRYVEALKRIKQQIEQGSKLVAWDCDDIGNKDTHCSWGLCSSEAEQWPDPADHIWPWKFENRGRVAPKYREEGQHCPFDMEQGLDTEPSGCFYRCRVFQGRKPTREEALDLYRQTLQLHMEVNNENDKSFRRQI